MIATAWVDTTEGRRWVIGRAAILVVFGILLWAIGVAIDPRVMWAGGGTVLFGAVVIVWALVHRSRGLPVLVFPSKPCIVPGCEGTMHFRAALPVADGQHTLEWPWRASWQCANDAAHVQLIAQDAAHEIVSTARSVGDSAKDSTGWPRPSSK